MDVALKAQNVKVADFVANGYSPTRRLVSVDLDTLSEDDRAKLARFVDASNSNLDAVTLASVSEHGQFWSIALREPTATELMFAVNDTLRQMAEAGAKKAAADAERKAGEAATRAAFDMKVASVFAARDEPGLDALMPSRSAATTWGTALRLADPRVQYPYPSGSVTVPLTQTEAWVSWVAEVRAAREVREAERAKQEETEKAAALESLREWALAHGSRRVHLMMEEGFEWPKVASEEFLDAHTPAGFVSMNECEDRDRTLPSEREIDALREARNLEGGPVGGASLRWMLGPWRAATEDEMDEADSDGEVRNKFPAVRLTVTAPGGKSRTVYRIT